jgi:hypothetical protein
VAAVVQVGRVHGRAVAALNARTHGLGRDRLVAGHRVLTRFVVSSEHLGDLTRRYPGGLASGLYLFERGPEDKASAEADEFPVALRLQVWTLVPRSGWQGPLLYFDTVLRPDAARLTSYQILSAAGMPGDPGGSDYTVTISG